MKKFLLLFISFALSISLKGQNFTDIDTAFGQYYAVSSDGKIYSSKNGTDWKCFDFNDYYKGFYEPCSFIGVAVAYDRVAVLGVEGGGFASLQKNEGEVAIPAKTVLYISTKGNIWALRELKYKGDNNEFLYYNGKALGVSYDEMKDEFIVLFEGNVMMTIPSCSHCNKLITL